MSQSSFVVMNSLPLLGPALTLMGLTFIAQILLYLRRIPAMRAARMHPEKAKDMRILAELPNPARWAQGAYNHLFEQPVLFYGLIVFSVMVPIQDQTQIALAWTYVGLRVLHFLVYVSINRILVRFSIFTLSSLMLLALWVRLIMTWWGV